MSAAESFPQQPENMESHFKSSQYLIEQPYIQITEEGYTIKSADGVETFTAVRPRLLGKNFLVSIASIFAAMFAFVIGVFMTVALSKAVENKTTVEEPTSPPAVEQAETASPPAVEPAESASSKAAAVLILVGALGSFIAAGAAAVMTKKALSPKRHMTLSGQGLGTVLSVTPDSGIFIFNHKYMLMDQNNQAKAVFTKNYFESFFRLHWHCHTPQGAYMFSAVEDSLILSLARRYFGFGRLIPLHFNFNKMGGKNFGSFIRRFSLRDKYKLNFDAAAVPAWIAVSFALLLDTGEER